MTVQLGGAPVTPHQSTSVMPMVCSEAISIALQYARKGIRANVILPGLMDTPMYVGPLKQAYAGGDIDKMRDLRREQCPMGRMGDAWDVANAALFLASDEANYITAAELVVDGGLTAKVS